MYQHTNSKGVIYYLNSQQVTLRGGHLRTIYYFSKDSRSTTACGLPEGKTVNENRNNGFLTLKGKE